MVGFNKNTSPRGKHIIIKDVKAHLTPFMGIELIPFSKKHLTKTFAWIHDPILQRDFLIQGLPTYETHIQYFENKLNNPREKVFSIIYNEKHIGNCGFKNIIVNKEAELWIYLGEQRIKHKGIGKIATKMLIEYGVDILHIEKIYLHVADFNTPAVRLYKNMGFHKVPVEDNSGWENRGINIIRMERRAKI